MRSFYLLISSLFIMFVFVACLPKQNDVENFFQSNSALNVKNNYKASFKLLLNLKSKIDKRNPNSYNKNLANNIYSTINNMDAKLRLKYNNKYLNTYNEYLEVAFLKKDVKNRNDYLILGMYYLIYDLYEVQEGHQLTSYSYNTEKIQRLYYNLQILRWKIKTAKDLDVKYLFLTWQNNWQVQLHKKLKAGSKIEDIKFYNLEYIKNKKEKFHNPSNTSFELILTQLLERSKYSLEILNVSASEMSADAIKAIFLFL